jgi:hypothetical protein
VDNTATDFVDVRERASGLGLTLTSELAILPRHFETAISAAELAHEAEASTVRKLLNAAGLEAQQLEPGGRPLPIVVQKSADWISPTIFVGSMLLSQNPLAIQLALNVLGSYIADLFKGTRCGGDVELTFVVEQTRTRRCRRVVLKCPVSGVKDLEPVLRRLLDE